MRLKTYAGSSLPELFAQAQAEIGADAVLLSVRRTQGDTPGFRVTAADPATARDWQRKHTRASRAAGTAAPSGVDRDGSAVAPAAPAEPEPAHAASGAGAVVSSPLETGGKAASRSDRGDFAGFVPLPSIPSEGRPFVLAVVGPTGSGKTTTIAKLATHPRAFRDRRVGIVNLDTYRVGAVEQLETFARLAGIPVKTVYESRQIPRVLRSLRRCEVILVDTPGRGPAAEPDVEAVQECLRRLAPDEVHLTVPAGVSSSRLRGVMEIAARYGATHILPTKRDEDPDDEEAFALAEANALPVRWVTDGHRVPGDLHRARARRDEPAPTPGKTWIVGDADYAEAGSLSAGVAH